MSGLVTAITMRKSATDPLLVNHLCPLMTYSSPSRTAEVVSRVGSDPAVLGSVMEKALRRSPSSRGCNHRRRCSSLPEFSMPIARSSALPESGALLPKTTGPRGSGPGSRASGPSLTWPKPIPPRSGGRWAAQSPCALTCSCRGRMTTRTWSYVSESVSSGKTSLPHESTHPLELLLEFGLGREVPGHRLLFRVSRVRGYPGYRRPHPATTVCPVPTATPLTFRPTVTPSPPPPPQAPLTPAERAVIAGAERALLDERRLLTGAELTALAALPDGAVMALASLAHQVRLDWCGPEVEIEGILSAKTGGCPEDCHFCSQSSRFDTPVKATPFLDTEEVLAAARETAALGASEFCIVLAVRGPDERTMQRLLELVPLDRPGDGAQRRRQRRRPDRGSGHTAGGGRRAPLQPQRRDGPLVLSRRSSPPTPGTSGRRRAGSSGATAWSSAAAP